MYLYTGEGLMKEGEENQRGVSENEVTPSLLKRTCQMIRFLTSGFPWFPQLIFYYSLILKL